MRALFSFIVEKVGTKEPLDPVTKEDGVWKIIDFFTRQGMSEIQNKSESNLNTIDERYVALYFKNHLNNHRTFERVT